MKFYKYDNTEINQFLSKIRSLEWQCAKTIYEKYKRKYNLRREDLLVICEYADSFSRQRTSIGKKINKDFLTQKLSEFCKETFDK